MFVKAHKLPMEKISILNSMRKIKKVLQDKTPTEIKDKKKASIFVLNQLKLIYHAIEMLKVNMEEVSKESLDLHAAIYDMKTKEMLGTIEGITHKLDEVRLRVNTLEKNYKLYKKYWEYVKKTGRLPGKFDNIKVVDVLINFFQEEIKETKIEKKQNLQLWKMMDILFTHYAHNSQLMLDKNIFE